ncbi:MAG: glycosyltransferase 87 family protein, partial [Gemmataceae bacterium]
MLTFAFVPTLFCLTVGQIGPLLLLGAVGFLVAVKQRRDGWAGAAAVLLAVKPHLVYLFWIALLLWTLRRRRWAVLGGGLLAGGLAVGVALLCNPHVLNQYWFTFTHQPPAQYRSPTLGMALRLLLGEEHFRLQFLAMLPGLAWFALHWRRQRDAWDWSERLPMLLLVSMLTAAYGAWLFDLILLLVPVLQRAAAVRRDAWPLPLGVFAALNGLVVVQLTFEVEYFYFLWLTPALLLAYLALRSRIPSPLV